MEKICGIYKITCTVTNKVYIGSSNNIYRRWSYHRCDLKGNKHHNQHLQNAYNKYGAENFSFSIIEECDVEVLLIREQYQIFKNNSHKSDNGYNIQGVFEWHPDRNLRAEKKRVLRRVIAISLVDNSYFGPYTISQACKEYGIKDQRLRDMCLYWVDFGNHNRSKDNITFVYEELHNPDFDYKGFKKKRVITKPYKTKERAPKIIKPMESRALGRKAIIMINEAGESYEYPSVSECVEKNNLVRSKVDKCLGNSKYKHRGCSFRFKEDGVVTDRG